MRKKIILLYSIVFSCISIHAQNKDFEAIKSNTTTGVSRDMNVKKINLVASKCTSNSNQDVENSSKQEKVLNKRVVSNDAFKRKSIVHRNLTVTVVSKEQIIESTPKQKIAVTGDKTHKKSNRNQVKVTLTAIPLTED